MHKPKDFSAILQREMDKARTNPTALARECGVRQATIQRIATGKHRTPRADTMQKLSVGLGKDPGYLYRLWAGESNDDAPVILFARRPPDLDDLSPTQNTVGGKVPLISWVQAGDWVEAIDNFQPGDAEDWLPCPRKHGPRTYALRVHGDSMTAAYGKSYPAGCIIFVDPDQAGGVANGARVVAKLDGDNAVTFKQYVEDAGQKYLKPLNPSYPMIPGPFRILGLVIGKYEEE